jgi:hypothetical protein
MELVKAIAPYGELIFVVCQLLLGAVMIFLSAKFASKKDTSDARKRADDAHHRIDLISKDIEGLPGYDVTNEIKEELKELAESRAANAALLGRALTKLDNIDDFLRSQK